MGVMAGAQRTQLSLINQTPPRPAKPPGAPFTTSFPFWGKIVIFFKNKNMLFM